jgi:hypothetical protein
MATTGRLDMKFTALYHSSSTQEGMSLHAAGCRDIKRERDAHGSNTQPIEADTVTEALNVMVDDELQEMGYDHNDVKVHNCTRRSGSAKEGTMTQNTETTTLDQVEVGQYIRPIPGTYRSRLTRTEKRHGEKPVMLTFGDEFAGSKFAKISRHGAAKRPGTYDVGFGPGQSWHAYPGTVKVEVKTSAKSAKQARLEKDATEARKAHTTTRTRKATVKQTEGDKQNAPTTKQPRSRQPVDAKLADKVKAERDNNGTAWWQIAVKFNLPGAGPLPAGKRGAGQARKLYKAANNGTLPASARSNGGSRNVSTRKPSPAKRRRNALGLAAMSAAELRTALESRTITYRYADENMGEADPVKVEKIKKTTLMGKDQRLSVTFFSDRSKNGFGNERTVYVDQIVEVR